ncbi:MAG TPA: putative Ig domain-containing protein [Bryobacteraceae bacterium]|nr:putative Ig domain-containing protein [Bryobacteraceae bacterium]
MFVAAISQAQSLSIVSGNGQVLLEQFPSQPFTVQARDASGNPVSGATVSFTLTQGLGTVQMPSVTTDANGMASTIVISSSLQPRQSFESETLNAASSQENVNFQFTTISSLGPTGPAQPGTVLLAPTSATGALTITGASGATLPGAIQISFVAATGSEEGMPIPDIGIRIVPFDIFALPAMCSGPGGTALANAQGIVSCDLVITAAPGTYEFSVSIGDLFTYRVFTLIVTAPQSCSYSLSATSQNVSASAASGSVNVLASAGCSWTAVSNAPWIGISSGATGIGNGPVGFNVSANTTGFARSGTLIIAGQTFTVSQSASATSGLSITTSATLPPATQNVPYSTSLAASGGTPGYTWSLSGTLPTGLTLSPQAGVISGTPSTAGVYAFTVMVTDAKGATAMLPVSLAVNSPGTQTFSFANVLFPQAVTGQTYSQTVQTVGGCQSTTPFRQSVVISETGTLPPGLSFSSGPPALISGSPTATGSYSFTLSATDFCNVTITQSSTIVVGTSAPPPAQFTATPASLTFLYANGGAQPATQSFALSAASVGTVFTASVASSTSWLVIVSGVSGATPATITVGLTNYSTLAAGAYAGAVTISPVNGGTPLQIPVTLTVTAGPMVTATPTALAFNLTTAGSKSSGQQSITIASTGAAVNFTAAASTVSGTGWLSVTPTAAATPATLTVTANAAGLGAGAYTGSMAIVPTTGPVLSLPVTLTVTGGPMLAVNPASLSFKVQAGLTPTPQAVALTSGPPIGFNVSISPASASNWLAVTAFTALTPATLNIAVNPTGLTPGTYSATLTISDPSNSSPSVTVPVSVNVAASPVVSAVTNAASFQAGPVAPAELLVLFGSDLGPATLVSTGSPLSSSLAGASVLFDGAPGIMLYTSAQQLAVIAPVGLAGRASTQVQVQYQGLLSPAVDVRVVDANPAIFMADKSGQGAIVNQDGTPNSVNSPAANGSVVLIFATGGGQTNPPTADGVPSAGVAPLLLPVSVQIDGIEAGVQYKGAAPGLAGLDQINVQIPPGVRTGVPIPVLLTVGTVTAPPVTLYVQAP